MRSTLSKSLAVLLCATAVAAAATTATLMSIQVKKADLRSTPSFLGSITASLQYGDRVAIDQQNGAWYKVTKPGTSTGGWLHTSALTKKTIVMTAGDGAQTGASSGEMALAGKGFNADVEKEFKAGHKDIDFAPVDRMARYAVSPTDIRSFVREGGLKPQGGVQ
jgi:uncharacterized protein YgiM (DUF1202 family)